MAVWRQNVVLMLVCVTFLNVGNGRVITTIKEGTKTTTVIPSSTETTVTTDKSISSINGTTSTSIKETTAVSVNETTSKNITTLINGTTSENMTSPNNSSSNITLSDITGNKMLDLAFIMDTTGSMGSYIESARNNIRNLVDEIAVNSNTDLRVALIEYRDHPPQDKTFVTRTNDFTSSVNEMKNWLGKAKAQGGGDTPEAVAEGLFDVTLLSWRPEAAKITVLISDAPPHGLAPWEDRTFKEGSPKGNDPIKIAQDLAKREITVYTVGCEPSINPYKDFFMALAYITGGQYIPLSDPFSLIQAIIGGAQEEMSLQKFSKDVEEEINRITASGAVVNETSIAKAVYEKLQQQGATSQQLLRNNKTLESASGLAQTFAASASMADVRMAYKSEFSTPGKVFHADISRPGLGFKGSSGSFKKMGAYPPKSYIHTAEYMAAPVAPALDVYADSAPKRSSSMLTEFGASSSSSDGPSAGESYSTVDSAVSFEQVARLVRKKAAKLSTP